MGNYFDSFDCQVQCEEFYTSVEEAGIDWTDANVPDVISKESLLTVIILTEW